MKFIVIELSTQTFRSSNTYVGYWLDGIGFESWEGCMPAMLESHNCCCECCELEWLIWHVEGGRSKCSCVNFRDGKVTIIMLWRNSDVDRGQKWRSGEQQHALQKQKPRRTFGGTIDHTVDNGHKITLLSTSFNDELCEICPSGGAMRCILYCIHVSCSNFHMLSPARVSSLHKLMIHHWYRSPKLFSNRSGCVCDLLPQLPNAKMA